MSRRSRHHPLRPVGWVVVVGAVLVPVAGLLVQAFADEWHAPDALPQRLGLRAVRAVARDPLLRPALVNSSAVALMAVGSSLVLAWPAARALARDHARGTTALLLVPLLVPPLAVGEGLTRWFVQLGLTDRLVGVALAHVVYVLPYTVLALLPAFTPALDELEDSAATLGAGPTRRLLTVTVPHARAALLLAVAVGFAVSWSQYGTSLAVGGGLPMLPLVAVPYARTDPQLAAALDLLLALPPAVLVVLATRALPSRQETPS